MDFAEQLRKLMRSKRQELVLSQEKMAEVIGVHANTYGRWELGRAEPVISHLTGIARALHYPDVESMMSDVYRHKNDS